MRKVFVMLMITMFCLYGFANSYQINERDMMFELLNGVAYNAQTLNRGSEAVEGIYEILSILKTDGEEAFGLIPSLVTEISRLNENDGNIQNLENLMDMAQTLVSLTERESYIDNMTTISGVTRGVRAEKSNVENDFEETKYEKIKGKVLDKILDLKVDFDVKLLDLNIAEGISLAAKYKWGLEPSYNDGYFTRIDAFTVGGNIKVGDIIKDTFNASLPLYLNISANQEIIFARQFKEQLKAATALPVNPIKKLPINAENATNLDMGDFVSIPAKMSIVVGASAGFGGGISGSVNTYYMLSGDFRINVLKIDQDKVRVKLIGMRRSGYGAGASAGFKFDLFGIKILDKGIGKIIDTNIIKINHQNIDGENFSVDYVFDLRHQDAREAYDKFMNANLKFRQAPTLNPFTQEEDLAVEFFNNLAVAENVYQEDRGKDERQRRVNRIFKASNFFEQESTNIKIGFNLIKFTRGRSFIENRLAVFDQDNIMDRYFIPVYQINKENKFLFGVWNSRETHNTYALFNTDTQWNIRNMETFVLNRRMYDKKFYARELRSLRESVINSLGPIAARAGIVNNFPTSSSKVEDMRMEYKMVLSQNTINSVLNPNNIRDEIFWVAMYNTMLDYKNELYLWVDHNNNNDSSHDSYWSYNKKGFGPNKMKLFKHFEKERWGIDKWRNLERFEKLFAEMVRETNPNKKMEKYNKIYRTEFYRTFFQRLTIEIAEVTRIPYDYKLDLHVRARGMNTYTVSHGNLSISEKLYNHINRMVSHITDTSYDMFDVIEYRD